jgi:hypothetical protein
MNARNASLLLLLTLLAGCAREEAGTAAPPAAGSDAVADVAPPIVSPEESADPAQPPSYEVSIASAAADHNKALERCATQPEAVRTQCEQEANAAFAETESALQPLRGNQE